MALTLKPARLPQGPRRPRGRRFLDSKGRGMNTERTTPDTIVLIHGFWVTPRSWEDWKARYESRGYRVLTPAYPGFEVEVEALNADPTPIVELTVPAVMEHLESVVREPRSTSDLDGPLGRRRLYSAPHGSRLRRGRRGNQLGTYRGCQAGTALADQVDVPRAQEPRQPPQGGRVHVRAVALRVHQHVQRGGGAEVVRALPHPCLGSRLLGQRAREHPPRPRRHLRELQNPDRALLLFISGGEDHSCPRRSSARTRSTTRRRHDRRRSRSNEGRAHLMPSQEGWEEVADYALTWAVEQAALRGPPTAGCRALHDRSHDDNLGVVPRQVAEPTGGHPKPNTCNHGGRHEQHRRNRHRDPSLPGRDSRGELADLRRRIAATRWPSKELVEDRSQGVQLATLQELARYWTTDYDFGQGRGEAQRARHSSRPRSTGWTSTSSTCARRTRTRCR